jgi:riboflavin synthase
MFTGIIEELGEAREIADGRIVIACSVVPVDSPIGSSIAVNGVCLTVVENDGRSLAFDLSPETVARTSLERLRPGAPVNLERPVTLATRLGGHIVQGHVDGVGAVRGVERNGAGAELVVETPDGLVRYLVDKGSVAVDGVSLTVAGLDDREFTVALVPHTLEVTTLGALAPGDAVNLEVDVIAKYVERLVASR